MSRDTPAPPVNPSRRRLLVNPGCRRLLVNLSRRRLLQGAGGLVLGFRLAGTATGGGAGVAEAAVSGAARINGWLRISAEAVTVMVASSEMGQGIFTALAQALAEELDCDWATVRVETVVADAGYSAFANPLLGAMATSGSTSLRAFFTPLRRAGAAARLMLVRAAARIWRVPADELVTHGGTVEHPPSGRQASYGALAALAARQRLPVEPPLRNPEDWRLIGRPAARTDLPDKVRGSAVFGLDVRVPGLVYAAVRHCPVFGGSLNRFDETALRSKGAAYPPGILAVVPIKETAAVAVVAESWWLAERAFDYLSLSWNEGPNAANNDAAITATLTNALGLREGKGVAVALTRGEPDRVLAAASRIVEATYQLPFLAHAALEPVNCTASVTAEGCELWAPTQDQGQYFTVLPELLGLKPEQIRVNTTFLGGGFGRRLECDFGIEAALLSRAVRRPVQVIWSREEDLRHDFYRPACLSRVRVGLDRRGEITAWRHRLAAPSVAARVRPQALKDGLDPSAVEGLHDQAYAFPAFKIEYVHQEVGVPVGYWRSAAHGSNAFVLESMLDEVAAMAGRSPLELRRALLATAPRVLRVLEAAAERAGWALALADRPGVRRGRGIACHEAFGSVVAQVAEVTVGAAGELRVDRIVAAVDCGLAVNPALVEAQIRGGIQFGLSAALHGRVSIEHGRVVEGNFDRFRLPTLAVAPEIEVLILDSTAALGGVGEIAVPPVAPAVANAIFAATGRRLRSLPLADHDLRSV